jgi:ribosomal protein S18 acetylase RimI-like enzyme
VLAHSGQEHRDDHRAGARTVDLTSRPSREAAGRLYERLGFAARSTRIYRYTFGRTA